MKCESCQSVLEEYFDGELAAKRAAEINAHLAGCPVCAAALAELQQAHALYAGYERGIEMTPDLWAGIAARIKADKAVRLDEPSSSGWRAWLKGLFTAPHISPAFAAALVVLAIGLTVVVMSYLHSRSANHQGNSPVAIDRNADDNGNKNAAAPSAPKPDVEAAKDKLAAAPGDEKKSNDDRPQIKEPKPALQKQFVAANHKPQAPPDPMKLVREAEQKYLAAIAILSQDVTRHRSQIDPSVLARFDSALSDIDRTIQETRQIVRRNPDDPVALQYLLAAYARKVDTLRAMTLD
jgi:Putative zinc-finger